jgi:hypothetical protein
MRRLTTAEPATSPQRIFSAVQIGIVPVSPGRTAGARQAHGHSQP